jgi:hypothetical protein
MREFGLISRRPPRFAIRLRQPGGGGGSDSDGAGEGGGEGAGPPSRLFALKVTFTPVRAERPAAGCWRLPAGCRLLAVVCWLAGCRLLPHPCMRTQLQVLPSVAPHQPSPWLVTCKSALENKTPAGREPLISCPGCPTPPPPGLPRRRGAPPGC